ncbi:mannitol dehydrogenase family protein [Nanchangia anserum]|uniref:Mannitol-1-phosphate 5-dehydrogenase n=1 Tax=Nanchangia anserum TaxID=2692125 RepID=A0A8I0GFY3_9ACTO|nr:mannitol dehydrogenase family protein [Nanchangia anserum]MBD3689314.1 mannitol dehydrogenase family protein [Nanchangia anserum]QOX81528.1 mannitol dehydrogenase family protein [Nanchangia anserum]
MSSHPHDCELTPTYDRDALGRGIVHFGMGNFHRAHQAMYIDRLARAGRADGWGIVGVGTMEHDRKMRDVLRAQDGMYTLVLKYPTGEWEPQVIGSVRDMLYAPEEADAVLDVLTAPSTRIVTLTVTEGGYPIDDEDGHFLADDPGVLADAADPEHPRTVFGFLVEALRRRRERGIAPFTVLSCDNLPGNGRIARRSVLGQARLCDAEFAEWIEVEVAFPNCMVDRITPVTTDEDRRDIEEKFGISDGWPVCAEPFEQWVIEDKFPAGRPPLEEAGAHMVDDVVPYELMKLRLLNAAHQSLAHWGRLLGVTYAHDAATDPDIAALTRAYLAEARPSLRPVPGIDLDDYVDTLFERFANASIADTLARLAQDASDRMPKFVLGTVRDNLVAGRSITLGAAMCAAWAQGVRGTAEDGSEIVQDDALAEDLVAAAREPDRAEAARRFLSLTRVFGELGTDERFVAAFTRVWRDLETRGVRDVMRGLR